MKNRVQCLTWAFCCCLLLGRATVLSAQSDSLSVDKAEFKSLFRQKFDPNKPYAAQLNPKAVGFVEAYVQKHGPGLQKMKTWGKPYFDLYDQILAQYNVPREMKYLSVIESNLQAGLVSWAGAVGPWQIMDFEAKRMGLRVAFPDERMDYVKSTHAAARIMRELYSEFQDWLLVVAAYNGGAGRVRQVIKKTGTREFWDLQYYLPEETRNHVKKFIATHYAMEGGGGWTTLTAAETRAQQARQSSQSAQPNLTPEEEKNVATKEINGRYLALVVANALSMDLAQFNRYNPGFEKTLAEGKNYVLRLPKDRMEIFEAKRRELLSTSLRALLEGQPALGH